MALSQEKKGTIAVSLTNFLDSGCIVASGVALAAWAIAFNFDNVWVSILGAVGANAFGAAVGALIGGFLADRFGRKFIYTYNLLVYATGVFLIMCAVNLPMLCAGIVISGLSVGAGVPSSWSYISEMSSSTSRAANIGISQFAWFLRPGGHLPHRTSVLVHLPDLRAGRRASAGGHLRALRRPVRHAPAVPHPVRGGAHRVESAAQAGGVEGLDGKAGRGRRQARHLHPDDGPRADQLREREVHRVPRCGVPDVEHRGRHHGPVHALHVRGGRQPG